MVAIPDVPPVACEKVYSDLTHARVERDSVVKFEGTYSIKPDALETNGYAVYGEGVLPSSLAEPFVRIKCLMEVFPGEGEIVRIGVITNYDPVAQTGSSYWLEFTRTLGVKSIKFVAGTIDISGVNVEGTEVDSDTENDTAAWMVGTENWATIDIHLEEVTAYIYLYDSGGLLKFSKSLTKQPTDLGTVGVFMYDPTLGPTSKPHIDNIYVDDESPYA